MRWTFRGGATWLLARRNRSWTTATTVPDSPGLGVELNEEVVKEHIRKGSYFAPTPQYDDYILDRFRQGGPYPHLDENGKSVISR